MTQVRSSRSQANPVLSSQSVPISATRQCSSLQTIPTAQLSAVNHLRTHSSAHTQSSSSTLPIRSQLIQPVHIQNSIFLENQISSTTNRNHVNSRSFVKWRRNSDGLSRGFASAQGLLRVVHDETSGHSANVGRSPPNDLQISESAMYTDRSQDSNKSPLNSTEGRESEPMSGGAVTGNGPLRSGYADIIACSIVAVASLSRRP